MLTIDGKAVQQISRVQSRQSKNVGVLVNGT